MLVAEVKDNLAPLIRILYSDDWPKVYVLILISL